MMAKPNACVGPANGSAMTANVAAAADVVVLGVVVVVRYSKY